MAGLRRAHSINRRSSRGVSTITSRCGYPPLSANRAYRRRTDHTDRHSLTRPKLPNTRTLSQGWAAAERADGTEMPTRRAGRASNERHRCVWLTSRRRPRTMEPVGRGGRLGGGGGLRPPIALMTASPIDAWPTGDYLIEPKFDGFRACLFRLPDRVVVQSRAGKDLAPYFPDVRAAAMALPTGTVLDGELVIWNGNRTDFALLQRRIARPGDPHPANLVCFDLLQHAEAGVTTEQPLTLRRELLTAVVDTTALETFALCPQTESLVQAEEWMQGWTAAGVEGVVLKRPAGVYRPGRRDWLKRKARTTVDLIIGGVTGKISAPRTLLLGQRRDDGRLAYRGSTAPLTTTQGRDLAPLLAAAALDADQGPWPNPLPGRWANLTAGEPVQYIPIEPLIVVEVEADAAFEHGRYRHVLRYVRFRAELL